ncbi:MAG: indole-3-glycerol phosphate synthase, partial [Eubacterium sp.]|nr:indole-3-glycerol phosphate synthase [Eubacterium sp.]
MILDKIVEDKKLRIPGHKEALPFGEARRIAEEMASRGTGATPAKESFYEALSKDGLSIIGEFKQASPSLGNIEKTMELPDRIK